LKGGLVIPITPVLLGVISRRECSDVGHHLRFVRLTSHIDAAVNEGCEMELATGIRSLRPFLRGLHDPVRGLRDALEEITRSLLAEFVDPATPPQEQQRITRRLALVRCVAGDRNYAVVVDRIQVCLLT